MGQKTKLTRRSFIGGAAALAAGAAAGLAGCAANGQQAVEEKTGATESWDEEFDVVVCGAGIAGLAAAVTVATEGDGASCLLLEKEPSPNGNSPFCAGSMLYCEDADFVLFYDNGGCILISGEKHGTSATHSAIFVYKGIRDMYRSLRSRHPAWRVWR